MFARSALAALALTVAAASPALAAPESRTVGFGDLNLATSQGRTALDQRLNRAAKAVCGVGDKRDLTGIMAANTCHQAAMTEARIAADAAIARKSGARVEVAAR
jgi:UrcA family protein